MQSENQADVIVVGGGIIGICSALCLAEQGVRATLIDQDDPGQGASFGNAGTISPWSIIPQAVPGLWQKLPRMLLNKYSPLGISLGYSFSYLPWFFRFLRLCTEEDVRRIAKAMYLLCGESVDLYKQHLQSTGHENLIRDSMYVHVFRNENEANVESLGNSVRAGKGAKLEKIDSNELRLIEPALSKEYKAAILIHGQSRALDPGKIGTVLSKKFRKYGGKILRAHVRGVTHCSDGNWAVHTDLGEYKVPKVVICAGAWSASLLRPLGITVPLAAERGYHLSFPDAGITLNNSVMDADNHVVANAMSPGLRIAGIADFAAPDSPPQAKHFMTLRYCAKSMIPDLTTPEPNEWMGVRPSFPDSLPLIEELPGFKGLFAAFGHSHYGLMMAPKTGQLVASLVTGTARNEDISVFGSHRF